MRLTLIPKKRIEYMPKKKVPKIPPSVEIPYINPDDHPPLSLEIVISSIIKGEIHPKRAMTGQKKNIKLIKIAKGVGKLYVRSNNKFDKGDINSTKIDDAIVILKIILFLREDVDNLPPMKYPIAKLNSVMDKIIAQMATVVP